jgi:hypothetical protein
MDPPEHPPTAAPPHEAAPPRLSLRDQARAEQRAKEDALGPEGRIKLALTLGLRAKALQRLGTP